MLTRLNIQSYLKSYMEIMYIKDFEEALADCPIEDYIYVDDLGEVYVRHYLDPDCYYSLPGWNGPYYIANMEENSIRIPTSKLMRKLYV
jgi:hypothetical protein